MVIGHESRGSWVTSLVAWCSGNGVGRINKVLYVGPAYSTGMGDRLWRANHLSISPS